MRALIIGGNGFIGSHLVDAFLAAKVKVRVFDRMPERYRAPLPDVEYYRGSLDDSAALSEALHDIDIVYHLASTTVPSTSNKDPIGDINSNLVNSVKLLQLMQQHGVNRIVYLSSGGTVYGIPEVPVVSERHPLHPICSYGIVKVAIENYMHMFHHLYGLEYVCLRVSNPYGPRQGHLGVQGVIGTFLSRMKEGTPIQIWGDGSIIRDYIYVTDLAELCVKARHISRSGIFNAGSGQGATLLQIVDILSGLHDAPVVPEFLPSRNYDVPKIVLDIEKSRHAFDWAPTVTLDQGIRATWKWLGTL